MPVLATSWWVEPVRAPQGSPPAPAFLRLQPSEPVAEEAPETKELLARVLTLLNGAASGLALADLRAHLSESSESLQRALAAGLRTKRLRRVGSHNKLRYMVNAEEP